MRKDEIYQKFQAVAAGVMAEGAKTNTPEEVAANAAVVTASYEAAFDLAADVIHNLGRIADAIEHIARNVPEKT